jgi:predicted RND superfamily exporter protein
LLVNNLCRLPATPPRYRGLRGDARRGVRASGIHDRIEALVSAAEGPEKTYFVGIPALKVRSAELMRSDILTFGPACFVVVSVVLLISFRTLRGMLLPAVTTGIGLIWTLGLMGYFDVPIDIGTITLPTLLIAVGSAYATHVVARYYEEVEIGGDGPPSASASSATSACPCS